MTITWTDKGLTIITPADAGMADQATGRVWAHTWTRTRDGVPETLRICCGLADHRKDYVISEDYVITWTWTGAPGRPEYNESPIATGPYQMWASRPGRAFVAFPTGADDEMRDQVDQVDPNSAPDSCPASTLTTGDVAEFLGGVTPGRARSWLAQHHVTPVSREPGRGGQNVYSSGSVATVARWARRGQGARTDLRDPKADHAG